MHPKRGELFDRFFPADVESMGRAVLTKQCWTDDECMASSPKSSADRLHAFGQADWSVFTVIGYPMVDYVIGQKGFRLMRNFVRNESNM